MPEAAIDQPAIGTRQLHGRDRYGALADGHRDGFAGVPLLPEIADLPCRRRHGTLGFVLEVNTGLWPQSSLVGIKGDLIDTRAVTHVIEINIARLHDAFMQGNGSVSALQVALMIMPVNRRAAGTMHGELIVDGAG